ncbi:MAG: hypothetical protein AAF289_14600 [Cyanobacteria bacterium P01_A01_bin.135]
MASVILLRQVFEPSLGLWPLFCFLDRDFFAMGGAMAKKSRQGAMVFLQKLPHLALVGLICGICSVGGGTLLASASGCIL